MRPRTLQQLTGWAVTAGMLWAAGVMPSNAMPGAAGDLQREVEQRLEREASIGALVRTHTLEVVVRDAEVILKGSVSTLWEKEWAVERARDTAGVTSVISELRVVEPESDAVLVTAAGQAIARYPHYTVFDYVTGSIANAVVTLRGEVTPQQDKTGDLYELVSRVPGVREIVIDIDVLSPGIGDERIRSALMRSLFGNVAFDRYRGINPGLHIIVRNGYVWLKGSVYDDADKILAEIIARQTFGVIRVENELRTRHELEETARYLRNVGVGD